MSSLSHLTEAAQNFTIVWHRFQGLKLCSAEEMTVLCVYLEHPARPLIARPMEKSSSTVAVTLILLVIVYINLILSNRGARRQDEELELRHSLDCTFWHSLERRIMHLFKCSIAGFI